MTKIQARVLSAFKLWVSEYFYDYISEDKVKVQIQNALDLFSKNESDDFIQKIVKQIRALIDYNTKDWQHLKQSYEMLQLKISEANDAHIREHQSKGFFMIKPMEVSVLI